MDQDKIKFADKLYLTFRLDHKYIYSKDSDRFVIDPNNNTRLGFMSPWGKDKAFEKRQQTQLLWATNWAANHMTTSVIRVQDEHDPSLETVTKTFYEYNKNDGKMYAVETSYEERLFRAEGAVSEDRKVKRVAEGVQPEIIDNVPLEGFRIDEEVKRYGWNGGNVVWRIWDPRGFSLEISSGNLGSILSLITVEQGVIKGRCIWGRMGAMNVLIPEGTSYFESAVKNTTRLSAKNISLRDVIVGDEVLLKDGNIGIYLGKYHILQNGYSDYNQAIVNFDIVKERYLFKITKLPATFETIPNQSDYWAYTSPSIKEIIKRTNEPLPKDKIADDINLYIKTTNMIMGLDMQCFFVSPTKIDTSRLEIKIRPMTIDESGLYLERDKKTGKIIPVMLKQHSYVKQVWPVLLRNEKFLSIERVITYGRVALEAFEIDMQQTKKASLAYVSHSSTSNYSYGRISQSLNIVQIENVNAEDHWYILALDYMGKELFPKC